MKKPVWNVFYNSMNSDEIKIFNVFNHGRFYDGLQKAIKKCKTKEEFAKAVKDESMYYFWAKCEWEILLSPWIGKKDGACLKIDVYEQLKLNWDAFVDYTWKSFGKNDYGEI